MQIDQSAITYVLGLIAIISVIFNVYKSFRNPQIKADNEATKYQTELKDLKREVYQIKETHLRSVEKDIKDLTTAVNDLSKTVVRLSTIIDERIPKGSPNLTPPGN